MEKGNVLKDGVARSRMSVFGRGTIHPRPWSIRKGCHAERRCS
jgi:hypothetical protein